MVKPAIKKIILGSLEAVKDSAHELGKAVSPAEMMNQLAGTQHPDTQSEVGKYLENLGDPALKGERLEKRKNELESEEERDLEEARKLINPNPVHMRPAPRERELTAYEQSLKTEEEKKKALALEAQQSKTLAMPASKPKGRLGKTSQKASIEGFKKDTKMG